MIQLVEKILETFPNKALQLSSWCR